jgi:tetratricopeptide (TPR) repeat protein
MEVAAPGLARSRGAATTCAAVVALLAVFAAAVAAADALEPSPYARQLAARGEPLDLGTLIDASLVLSLADGDALGRTRARMDTLVREVREVALPERDLRARGNMVLVFLHERLLEGYVEEQTRVDVALQTGRYNCVSSAILYMILARAVDLDVVGVRTHDHAFCAVRLDGRLVDVETTNLYGFDPGSKHEFQDQFGKTTGFTYVPANRDPSRVETGELGMLALVPQNLASLATQRRQYAAALGAAVDGYAVGRDAEARTKLVITISNMASWQSAGSQFAEAIALLDRAAAVYGNEPRLARLKGDIVYNQVVALMQKGDLDGALSIAQARHAAGDLPDATWRDLVVSGTQTRAGRLSAARQFDEAIATVDRAAAAYGGDPRLARLRSDLVHDQVVGLLQKGDVDGALALADSRRARGEMENATWRELVVSATQLRAQSTARDRGLVEALRLVRDAIDRLGNDARLVETERVYIHNYEVEAHNAMAVSYNAGRYDEARTILEKALQVLPESSRLRADLATVVRALEQPARR